MIASKAVFVAEYTEPVGSGVLLAPELILMMLPPFSGCNFKDSWIASIEPKTLILNWLWKVSADTCSIGS